jgi:chlorophyll(ide) b reductase
VCVCVCVLSVQANIQNVGIHNLSPGMVTTELLMSGADTPTAKFFINCLAEEAAFVAQDLVPRVRQVPLEVCNLVPLVCGRSHLRYM